jgi:hypothetical protein
MSWSFGSHAAFADIVKAGVALIARGNLHLAKTAARAGRASRTAQADRLLER